MVVGVDHDGVGLGDDVVGGPLATQADGDVDAVGRALLEAGGQQLDAGVVFMLTRAVAGTAGDHEDVLLFFGRHAGESAAKDERAEEEGLLHGRLG
jgi:hypothetical protein